MPWNPRGRFVEGELLSRSSDPGHAVPLNWREYRAVYSAAFSESERHLSRGNPLPAVDDLYLNLLATEHPNIQDLREGDPKFWEQLAVIDHARRDVR